MKLPSEVLETRARYVEAFPLWVMPAGPEAEERARSWTYGLTSQVCYEHPNQGYGSKQADPTRPLTKDTIAQQRGAQLLCWDMLTGAGTGAPTLTEDPDSLDITGQIFVPVEPVNVIEGDVPSPEPTPPSTPTIPYNESYSVEFGQACNDVYAQCGATPDGGMISVYSQRCAWDYYVGGLSWEDAQKKHINGFRGEYGLPPL